MTFGHRQTGRRAGARGPVRRGAAEPRASGGAGEKRGPGRRSPTIRSTRREGAARTSPAASCTPATRTSTSACSREALADAAASGQAPGLAYVLFQAAELGVEQRDPQRRPARVDRLIPLAREQGYALWLAMAEAIEGWVAGRGGRAWRRRRQGQRCGLGVYEAQGVLLMQPFLLAMLGAVLGRAGPARRGRPGARRRHPAGRREGRGDLGAGAAPPQGRHAARFSRDQAEASYLRSLEIARSQGARLAELRAATSLARLWAGQGERQRAVDLLAPVHAWFTEGFDTPDLRDAASLLAELGAPPSR